ncbi:MAG: NACHT domain-containing protein [Dolichospermum sp. DEX182a]|nr:NACHT domain-containing protein [Dolichospermum sp. DEX182a]
MNQNRKPRSVQATLEGRQKLQESKANKRNQKGKPWTFPNIADATGLDEKTIKSFFYGKPVDENTAIAIVQVLDLQSADIIDLNELYPSLETTVQEQNEIDWLKICHTKLEDQQKQIRKNASEMGFELDFPPVPLGLVERKHQQRRDENVDRKDVYQLEKEVIAKIYEHDDFLEQVINQNPAGKNKHIAMVGEPGAGKTTLLTAIASYIKNENKELPIVISLGSLQGMTLEEYILKKWLPDITPTSEIEEQLKRRFSKDGVWLLLDGVDEMGESSPTAALNKISQALTDWLGKARVVLTCRLNVWDANPLYNDLRGFDTYKTQEFNPEQIDQFIENWFKCDDKIQRGEELKAKLREPGKERIRELVTNPLRLSLLCQIFYQDKHGELPETKAGLFDLYAKYFYYWKSTPETQELRDSPELQKELHQGLGKLALEGIKRDARFRLNKSLVVEVMTERLFKLARDVGWLNLVDRDVYAFFHPNFQEYFAALVIDDWHYFLNHNNANPNPSIQYKNKKCVYRVFEKKWKEVILFWMGREDIISPIKNEFMLEMSKFEDGCDFKNNCVNIWKWDLFHIAENCFQEFTDCSLNKVVYEDEDEEEILTEFDNVWKSELYTSILPQQIPDMTSSPLQKKIRASLINNLGIWMHYPEDNYGYMYEDWYMYDEYEKNKEIIKQLKIDFQKEITWINTAQTTEIIDQLILNDNQFIRGLIINRLIQIFSEDNIGIADFYKKISCNSNDKCLEALIYVVHQIEYSDLELELKIVKTCVQILEKSKTKTTIIAALDYLHDISHHKTSQLVVIREIVKGLNKKHFDFLFDNNLIDRYQYCYAILLNCSSKMAYLDFYCDWHHPLKNLEEQFTDTHSLLTQLQPTEKTYPLTLNLKTLQDETDISAIAQKICNQIYPRFFHENLEIPQVNNAPQLERIILQVRNYLKKENLALIINNCEPNQEMIKFCNKLTDVLHIAFITQQPLDAPLKGFPNQPNLLNVIQHWINEIG